MELEKVVGGTGVSPELREASLELMRYMNSLFTVHNCVGMGTQYLQTLITPEEYEKLHALRDRVHAAGG